ncbi:protein GLUTELIN PRECURSOR ACCUMULATION 3 isoform X2 [Cheilinus undulatus]|uniref:protein GLUTELIN PRECURSOR ACCUMULATION 3 isoform X2 n=1 Tax=Cheilinus undulatus TaxID=241271 RepID=UPI001BD265C9|nr:protein GLUTELIN PRECURSOR ACCUMULATION 3 isoform X2 [Cheilinus undulatus]
MGKMTFYVLYSLRDAPRQFFCKSNRKCYQVHVPLPLPKQLVVFGLGEWKGSETTISVEVVVSAEVPAQKIGTLTSQARCMTWEGEWSPDIVSVAAERGRRGVYGKIVLTVCGEAQDKSTIFSSTPLVQRKCLFPDEHNATDLSSTLPQSIANDTITAEVSHLGESVSCAEIQVNKIDSSVSTMGNKARVWPTEKTPRRTVIGKRGHLTWSLEDLDSLSEDMDQASTPKRMRMSRMNSQDDVSMQIKSENREVSACPSERWSHTMCLSDPDTAILIGGETADKNYCKDSLWKFELDNDFWFPMNSSSSGPVPPCARGHSATYDPESKSVYVYGGLRESQCYSELYILDTLTWKWKLVNAKGNVPNLAYHSASFYKKELFVFGGVESNHLSADKPCSNALYIFNPEFELWYQPIVEGDMPLPRFGHSATLILNKLIIFGGRKTATYLNDLHVLDLGFMEYTAVKCGNMPPLPRGFHAALPVSDKKILISGGCCAVGALQDVHVFNTDTNMWSALATSLLCSKPRAGHSMIHLGCSIPADTEKHKRGENGLVKCSLLVFGGSDCSGTFYNDTVKCTVDIPVDK